MYQKIEGWSQRYQLWEALQKLSRGKSAKRARKLIMGLVVQIGQGVVPTFLRLGRFWRWGGVFKKRNGRLLDGRTRDQMPGPVRVTRCFVEASPNRL
jgi:protein gp37